MRKTILGFCPNNFQNFTEDNYRIQRRKATLFSTAGFTTLIGLPAP
jgi:hypothetical protein